MREDEFVPCQITYSPPPLYTRRDFKKVKVVSVDVGYPEVCALLKQFAEIEIRHPGVTFTVEYNLPRRAFDMEGQFRTVCVHTQRETPLQQHMTIGIEEVGARTPLGVVRHALHEMLYHEVDEWLWVGGKGIHDPHKDARHA